MDCVTLSQTTILYTFSALAQTCAALVGFIGAIAIYQVQQLRARTRSIWEQLDRLTYEPVPRRGFSKLRPSNLKDVDSFEEGNKLLAVLVEELAPQLRRGRRVFVVFGLLNLGAIALSFLGFRFVEALAKNGQVWLALLAFYALLVCLATLAMALELFGSLKDWLVATHLSWLVRLLEREEKAKGEGDHA